MLTTWVMGGLILYAIVALVWTSDYAKKKYTLHAEMFARDAGTVFIVVMLFWPMILLTGVLDMIFPPKDED